MLGGWKQKSGWIQIPPASCVPSLFPFYLNYLSVSLSRVCAPTLPLTNNTGSRVALKRGPLPDWPVWTREQMISDKWQRQCRGERRQRG